MALYHFVGIGGSGMSALAQLLAAMGNQVTGSDRNLDLGAHLPIFDVLSSQGIHLFPQNGSGVKAETTMLVISTAIEETVPDFIKARTLPIPVRKRADLLAHLFNERYGIAVAGTSGKSTITGMIGHILSQAGQDPVIVNGGMMKNFPLNNCPNNVYVGSSNVMVIESDESDGSIIKYLPALSIINNISKDHKIIPELLSLFKTFAHQTKEKVIMNADCPHVCSLDLNPSRTVTYSLEKDSNVKARVLQLNPFDSTFEFRGRQFTLRVPGLYNIYNALAAISVAIQKEIALEDIQEALESFEGISRRFEFVGKIRETCVINDFAHNPEKINASLKTSALLNSRRILVFQPHGFAPTRFLKKELIDSLICGMAEDDVLFIPEIFYVGGTTRQDISSQDLVKAIRAGGRDARYKKNKEAVLGPLIKEIQPGDTVHVMGGRDDTLISFCQKIFHLLQQKFKRNVIKK